MFFRDIAGHENIKQKLLYTIKGERVSHALLFAGPEGNGKLALSVAYAQYLSCSHKKENDSCGECPSCKKYTKLIHPDLHFVFPVIKTKKLSKPVSDDYIIKWREFLLDTPYHGFNLWLDYMGTENQQASIYTEESHQIIKKLNFKTYEAEYKVMIIWMPEKMNVTASNKLLKLIEEPPPKTLFILVTENTEQIIKTILSRTQIIKIPKVDDRSVFNAIKENHKLDDERINDIVKTANGNYLRVNEIIKYDADNTDIYFSLFAKMMRFCYSLKFVEISEWVDELSSSGREKQKVFLKYALKMLRENLIMGLKIQNGEEIAYSTRKEKQFSEKFCQFIHQKNIHLLSDEFNKAYNHIERNGYDRLVFLDLAIKTARLLKIKKQ